MENDYNDYHIYSEQERAARRLRRMKIRERRLRARRRRQFLLALPVILACVAGAALLLSSFRTAEKPEPAEAEPLPVVEPGLLPAVEEPPSSYEAHETADTVHLGEEFPSVCAVVVDIQSDAILAEKNARLVIPPASMTKILTLLVAAEQITDLDGTFTMTAEIADYCYNNDCSIMGLKVDETMPVRELLYGTILPSGADAALGLAVYAAGSQEAFVELMNQKLEELGLSDTAHFTNCVGLYDEHHNCTVYDMAMILKAAMENPLCREVLSTHTHTTLPTDQHPEGLSLSNWFLRKIEDHDAELSVRAVGAKTGFVSQSGSCAASWGEDSDGNAYICVTANAYSSWRAIFDHVELYKNYCGTGI